MSDALSLLRTYRWRAAGAAGVLLAALLFGGCGGANESLSGTITNKEGKPVTWGTVSVVGPDNRVYSAPIQPDGTYRIAGLPRGPVRLAVSSPNPTPQPVPAQAAPAKAAPGAAGGKAGKSKAEVKRAFGADPKTIAPPNTPVPQNPPGGWTPIPGKYANPQTSGLTANPGGGTHNITVN